MARGFFSGAIWGTVLSVGGLGTISVLTPDGGERAQGVPAVSVQTHDDAQSAADTDESTVESSTDETSVVGDEPTDTQTAVTATPGATIVPDGSDTAAVAATDEPTENSAGTAQTETAAQTAESPAPVEDNSQPGRRPTEVSGVSTETAAPTLATPTQSADVAPEQVTALPKPDLQTESSSAALDAPNTSNAPNVSTTSDADSTPNVSSSSVLTAPNSDASPNVSVNDTAAPKPTLQSDEDVAALDAPATPDAPNVPAVEESAPDVNVTSTLASPTSDAIPSVSANDATTAPKPILQSGEEVAALDAPTVADAPNVTIEATEDTAPSASTAGSLSTPDSELALSISTEPAQPPAPAIPTSESALEPESAESVPSGEQASEGATTESQATTRARPQVRKLVPDTTVPSSQEGTVETAALSRPTIGQAATSLLDRNSGKSARLPSIGGSDQADQPQETADVATAEQSELPALKRFAADNDSDPNLPQLAIILIDDGSGPLGPDTLDDFPFPVTFALDPGQANSTDRMKAYRALGYEVATLVQLPQSAQPSDVEQNLAGSVAAVPEAVALLEAPNSGLQSSRDNAEQAAEFAAESGHGLIFLPNGLNTAQSIAQREDVPAVSILRDFDGQAQDARTKRRFLDGAAFRARQDGAAVMLGRLTPDTMSALVLWGLQDRASSVSMVPVSAVLSKQN